MNRLFLFTCCLFLFAACSSSRQQKLIRKWHAVKVENAELDKQIAESRAFFDTVGTSTDAATNEQLYGVRNMDSMRAVLREQLDSFVAMQQHTVENTWMDFRKDSVLIADFGNGADTVKWYLDDDGNLILNDEQSRGTASIMKFEILQLADTLLKFRYTENGFSSEATMKPDRK